MVKATVDKVLVTHRSALTSKYGAAYAGRIRPAIDALIAADAARGLATRLVHLDVAADMRGMGGAPVTDPSSAKRCKAAIDAVFAALAPDYLCLLGAPDVIAHQPLDNPIASDGDDIAWSDLPYACEAGYSRRIEAFLRPTRVVGRLPDVTGDRSADYLVRVLGVAARAKRARPATFADGLCVGAKVWRKSTAQSAAAIFGAGATTETVPAAAPPWMGIARRSHFFNCHGATADYRFYGQQGSSYPVAHDATELGGLVESTVAAMECCYGAELYDPSLAGGQHGLCNAYLARGAHGYFGSSTIAYGPPSGNGQADLACQYFMRHVLSGASTGEAALRARLDFIAQLSVADPTDLKTLAQFNLMGDPSLHPVDVPEPEDAAVAGHGAAPKSPPDLRAASRPLRRRHLAALGEALGSLVAAADTTTRTPMPAHASSYLDRAIAAEGARRIEMCAFRVREPASPRKSMRGATAVKRIDVAVGELPAGNAPFRRLVVVVARQTDRGALVRRAYSR